MRVQGVLAVSRAIGDINYKDYISSEPEISSIQISHQDQLLILSTDGLYKCYSKSHVANKILELRQKGLSLGQISTVITNQAVEEGSPDNITLMIIDLSDYYRRYHQKTVVSFSDLDLTVGKEGY